MKDGQREAEKGRMYEEMGLLKVLSHVSSNALFPESGSLFTPDLIDRQAWGAYCALHLADKGRRGCYNSLSVYLRCHRKRRERRKGFVGGRGIPRTPVRLLFLEHAPV